MKDGITIVQIGNPKILALMFHDRPGRDAPWHNAHMAIWLHGDGKVNPDALLAECLKIDGAVKDDSGADLHGIRFGTVSPIDPKNAMKKLLGLLQERELLSEIEVRDAYQKLGFGTPNTLSVAKKQPPYEPSP